MVSRYLKNFRNLHPHSVIMISGHGNIDTAVEAIKRGLRFPGKAAGSEPTSYNYPQRDGKVDTCYPNTSLKKQGEQDV